MKSRFTYLLYIILILTTASCSSVYYIQIQTGAPGPKDLPSDIQSLALVNRTVDSRYYNYAEDTLQQLFYIRQFKLDTVLYDLEAVDTVTKALAELLFESGRYDVVIPENRFLPHKKNAFISEEMPWEEVKEICNTFNTDAVLALDHFKTSISTTYDSKTVFDQFEDNYYKVFSAVMAIQYEALFRVYDPRISRVVNTAVIKDTLWWEHTDLSNRSLFQRFTSVKDAMVESGIVIALDYSDKIATSWKNEQRKYYDKGNPQFDQAHTYAKNNEWEQAMEQWLFVAEHARGKPLKSKAEYNVAFAFEMLGDLDQAIRWGLKSYETYYHPLTVEYLNILKKRKTEADKFSHHE